MVGMISEHTLGDWEAWSASSAVDRSLNIIRINYQVFFCLFQKKDFLQLMIDAAEAGGDDPVTGETNVEEIRPRKKIPLTQKELISQVISS